MAKMRSPNLYIVSPATSQAALVEKAINAAVGALGMPWLAVVRDPSLLTPEELQSAKRVIALVAFEPGERVEVWELPALCDEKIIDARVNQLIARMLGGGGEPPPERTPELATKPTATKRPVVKVGRETKGRKGKGVTTIFEVPLDEAGLRELAATLKQRCGTGGSVEDARIVIQGDQRDRVTVELEKLGYRVKRVGG